MRDMLLSNGEKMILIIKWQKNLAEFCLFSSVLWKVELVSNEIGY